MNLYFVIPAKAGIQGGLPKSRCWIKRPWIPAFAGMTKLIDLFAQVTSIAV
jgi:hypothetical protein